MAVKYIQGTEPINTEAPKTQVYKATHMKTDGGEWKCSPVRNRSFISFMYGGKKIEDFNFIATISEGMMHKPLYSGFEDITTKYDVLDGQFYWGTHMEPNQLSFVLATDEITEEQLNDFVYWFKPGVTRELVLAEHPNRAIMARVAAAPEYSVLPFEKKVTFTLDSHDYNTSTTMYRGSVNLSFIMDEPYWYARNNFFPHQYHDAEDKFNPDQLDSTKGTDGVDTLGEADFTKVIVEDHIPHLDMFLDSGILLGDEGLAVDLNNSIVGSKDGKYTSSSTVLTIDGIQVAYSERSATNPLRTPPLGRIGVLTSESGITLGDDNVGYLFYSGTAPCRPIITFTLNPIVRSDSAAVSANKNHYIVYPLNSYSAIDLNSAPENQYNTLYIGNTELRFSLPSVYLGFNAAKRIVQENGDLTGSQIRELIRDNVHDYYARTWALACLTGLDNDLAKNFFLGFSTRMNWLIMQGPTANNTDYSHSTFTFNSQTGRCIAVIEVRVPDGTVRFAATNRPIDGTTKIVKIEEYDAGDMMRSGYPIIDQRCYFDSTNRVTKEQCLKVWTDYPGPTGYPSQDGLTNVTIKYKNMYL